MLPRWHILWGAAFTLVIWIAYPSIWWAYLVLVFLASFLIDFDHYIISVIKTGKWKLSDSFEYYREQGRRQEAEKKKGIYRKWDFHLFHTIEFLIVIGILGTVWMGFFYIFIGMVFHSLLDLLRMAYKGEMWKREFFFFNWAGKMIGGRN